jgi:hypothetical protein
MGMHFKTAYGKRDAALSRLRELYSMCEICGLSSDELAARKQEIFAQVASCPRWVRDYLAGWCDGRWYVLQQKLVFFYIMPDGSKVSTWRDREDYYEKRGYGPRETYEQAERSGHFWSIKATDGSERLVEYYTGPKS